MPYILTFYAFYVISSYFKCLYNISLMMAVMAETSSQ